jgi:hypothetical protein
MKASFGGDAAAHFSLRRGPGPLVAGRERTGAEVCRRVINETGVGTRKFRSDARSERAAYFFTEL